ncbi:hypothetical protein C8R47DRAFT_1216207 [Mycena vitilis]|nr:hypothetical protein C8R47DRAFT_1216207 [Mycena vitilis]
MQIQLKLSAVLLALALQVASVAVAPDSVAHELKRQSYNDCFNEGYETGVSAGCNAVRKRTLGDVTPRSFSCSGAVAAAYNKGFQDGFQSGYDTCFNS